MKKLKDYYYIVVKMIELKQEDKEYNIYESTEELLTEALQDYAYKVVNDEVVSIYDDEVLFSEAEVNVILNDGELQKEVIRW